MAPTGRAAAPRRANGAKRQRDPLQAHTSSYPYRGFGAAMDEGERSGTLPPPKVILNAPTPLMKQLGYSSGYRYAHDEEGGIADQQHLPNSLAGRRFYEPTERGYEAEAARRMKEWERLSRANGPHSRKP